MTIATSETNEALSAISTAVNQQTEVMTTIVEGVSVIETGVSGVSQSIDSNGLTLSDISLMLNNVSETLTSIDTKLSTESSVTDKLVCFISNMHTFVMGSTDAICIQASLGKRIAIDSGALNSDGWSAVSMSSNGIIFQK